MACFVVYVMLRLSVKHQLMKLADVMLILFCLGPARGKEILPPD